MSGELLTSEEAQELTEQGEPDPRPSAFQPVPIPATIIVKYWGKIDAPGGNSWGYTPYGIFVGGGVKQRHDYGDLDPPEHDVLFPYNSVIAVEFDYPAFFASQGLNPRGEEVEEDGNEDSGD